MQKSGKEKIPVRVIPEYRNEIDVQKICRALIMTAKTRADREHHNNVEKNET